MFKKREYLAEFCTAIVFSISLAFELILNGMKPWVTPDSAGYLARYSWPACLGQPRIPIYGWLVNALALRTGGYGLVPWLQFLLFAACTLHFIKILRRADLGHAARAAIGISIGFSNLALIWCRAIMPTLPAVSFLILAMSGVVMAAQSQKNERGICVLIGFLTALAWLFDPGLLMFIFVLPLMFWSLATIRSGALRFRKCGMIFVFCLAPFLAISSLRAAEVGSFGIVSYGGFQMSGMAALILSPATIGRLPPALRPLAAAILTKRTAQEQNGTTIATPENSIGERSFTSEAAGYFDILARTHDSVLYGAVATQRIPGESWVDFNSRLQNFAIATVKANPINYAVWVLGGLSRSIGRTLVMNPVFLISAALSLILFVIFPYSCEGFGRGPGISSLILIIIWYFIGTMFLSVVITFPAQRYIDVGSPMLAALPIYALIRQSGYITERLRAVQH